MDLFSKKNITLNTGKINVASQSRPLYLKPEHVSQLGTNVASAIMSKLAEDYINSLKMKENSINGFKLELDWELRRNIGYKKK